MIATMQTAHARFTLDFGAPRRPGFDGTARGRLLSQGIMNAIFVMVGNVFGQQPFEVTFIEGNDVVQEVAAATAHPALRNTVLPRTFEGSPDRAHL